MMAYLLVKLRQFSESSKVVCNVLGIDQPDSTETFPNHTFGVVHEKSRSYFIYADSDKEKVEWMQMFQLCCDCIKGTGCQTFSYVLGLFSSFYTLT